MTENPMSQQNIAALALDGLAERINNEAPPRRGCCACGLSVALTACCKARVLPGLEPRR